MNDVKLLISSLVISEYKKDEAVKCLYDIFSDAREYAVRSYSRLCEILMLNRMTLSEYIYDLTVRDEIAVFAGSDYCTNDTVKRNLGHDIKVLAKLAKIPSESLTDDLRKRFDIPETVELPVYDCGNTDISFEKTCEYRSKYGTSFYAKNKAFIYENNSLSAVAHFDRIKLSELKNYETQRNAVISNTCRFIDGRRYSNVLLYGDRGTGKSCTVKAVVNEFPELRIVLVPKASIMRLYDIYDRLRGLPLKFILFLDDMSFGEGDAEYGFLKQALEGSVNTMPENCAIYATTNRRHIIKETASESSDEHHGADARDEKASLADRFGLYLTFMSPDKKTYLEIAEKIAADRGIDHDPQEFAMLAERFAVRKGNRSPRTARQFVDSLDGCSPDNSERKVQ